MKKEKRAPSGYSSTRFILDDDAESIFDDDSTLSPAADKPEINRAKRGGFTASTKEMMLSSLMHLTNPFTIIVILLLTVAYILLGAAGTVSFTFNAGSVSQYINTNLDIIVNAFLGFFYGPVTCALGVGVCCIAKIIASKSTFFVGNLIGALAAGFCHGWILYRLKPRWFRSRFKNRYANLIFNIVETRFVISAFINILLMSVIYKLFVGYPISVFILRYSKSGVPIRSGVLFLKVFFVSILFESAVIFVAITVASYIMSKAFPLQFAQTAMFINRDGSIGNFDDDSEN